VSYDDLLSDSVAAEVEVLNRILVSTNRELVREASCPKAGRFLLSKNRSRKLVLQALLPDYWACRY
jgi:hypothetical protein